MKTTPPSNSKLAAQRYASLNRRHFLRGLGTCLALPAFESLLPSGLLAATPVDVGNLATSSTGSPVRMAFVYFPNGAIPATWWPSGEDKDFQLNKTMEPLEPVKHRLQVMSGLDCINATPGPDGAGDHARASGSFMTGMRVKKTAGADIHAGTSIDQVAANQIGHLTRFPSLELTCDAVRKSGSCDSGYSCAYQYNLAWKSPTQPLAPEPNPRLVFERMFGSGAPGERQDNLKRRQERQRSILDSILGDANDVQKTLAYRDKQKLDEYLGSVRELEKRIEKAEQSRMRAPDPAMETPAGVPENFEEYVQVMFDMMFLAFQTDSTRVATFLLANEGSNRAFPELEIPEGHHYLTHHQNNRDKIEKVKLIDLWYMKQFGKFLEKMEQTKEADGNSLLHNSMIVYGSGNSDGNRHTHVNLPVVLAGGGGGALTVGRYAKFKSAPITNLYLSMLDRMGAQGVEKFGDSTGRLEGV